MPLFNDIKVIINDLTVTSKHIIAIVDDSTDIVDGFGAVLILFFLWGFLLMSSDSWFLCRGDKAFCSVECRSQQMILDERSKNSFKPGASTVSVAAA